MKHLVYLGDKLIWNAPFPFPQQSLMKFLISERSACKCDYGCWLNTCPNGCPECEKVRKS